MKENFLNICRNCFNGFAGKERDFFFELMSLTTSVDGDNRLEWEIFGQYGMSSHEFQSYFNKLMFNKNESEEEQRQRIVHNITLLYNECAHFWFKGTIEERMMKEFVDKAIQEARENNQKSLFYYQVPDIMVIILYNCEIIGCIPSDCQGYDLDTMSQTIKELHDETNMFIIRDMMYFQSMI